MKRAQTEIIGVIVIVIILVIGGLFMIRLSFNRESFDTDSYVEPEMAQSFLTALLNTMTDLNINLRHVIVACHENTHHYCRHSETGNCCRYAERFMTNALEATLGEWGKDYRLSVRQGDDQKINDIPQNSRCASDFVEKEEPGSLDIPNLGNPDIEIKLEIC